MLSLGTTTLSRKPTRKVKSGVRGGQIFPTVTLLHTDVRLHDDRKFANLFKTPKKFNLMTTIYTTLSYSDVQVLASIWKHISLPMGTLYKY